MPLGIAAILDQRSVIVAIYLMFICAVLIIMTQWQVGQIRYGIMIVKFKIISLFN